MVVACLLALGWFAVFLVGHLALFRRRSIHNRFQAISRIFGGCILGEVLTTSVGLLVLNTKLIGIAGLAFDLLAGVLVMFSLFVLYMPFYYSVSASLSIQTVIVISRSPGGQLPVVELTAPAVFQRMLQHRVQSMVASNNLRQEGDTYYLTPKGRFISRTFRTVKALWRLGPGG